MANVDSISTHEREPRIPRHIARKLNPIIESGPVDTLGNVVACTQSLGRMVAEKDNGPTGAAIMLFELIAIAAQYECDYLQESGKGFAREEPEE